MMHRIDSDGETAILPRGGIRSGGVAPVVRFRSAFGGLGGEGVARLDGGADRGPAFLGVLARVAALLGAGGGALDAVRRLVRPPPPGERLPFLEQSRGDVGRGQ